MDTDLTLSGVLRNLRMRTKVVKPIAFAAIAGGAGIASFNGGMIYGAAALVALSGTLLPLARWYGDESEPTLPFISVYGVSTALWYGFPLVVGNMTLEGYTSDEILMAAAEVACHMAAVMAGSALISTTRRPPSRVRVLLGAMEHGRRATTMLFCALLAIVFWEYASFAGWADVVWRSLPNGSANVIRTLSTAGVCGCCLLLTMELSTAASGSKKAAFWGLWLLYFLIRSASLLLSAAVSLVAATALGLALGGRRIPWTFLAVATVAIAMLNRGKFEMRQRYWPQFGGFPTTSLTEIYFGWISTSTSRFLWSGDALRSSENRNVDSNDQTLSQRLSNLQMLLYAQRGVRERGIPLLEGSTYRHGFLLLVPRIVWPDKPRSHASQIQLSMHYGLQSESQTFETYIAWGILPEAYANFGPFGGSIISGLVIGVILGWLSKRTIHLPLAAMGSILGIMLLSMCIEWPTAVSSIIVTSTVQYVVALSAVLYPLTTMKELRHRPRAMIESCSRS